MKIVEPYGNMDRVFLDGVIRKTKRPKRLLLDLLFPESTIVELSAETVQVDTVTEGLQIAPFVAINGRPVTLTRGTSAAQTITTPHIAVDLPLQAGPELVKRMAGETGGALFNTSPRDDRERQAIDRLVQDDLRRLNDSIVNREEWMVGKILQGSITYSTTADATDSFTVTMNKPNANTITATTGWNDADPADAVVSILETIDAAKKIVADNEGPVITHALMGANVDAAFMALLRGGHFKNLIDNNLRMSTGTDLTLTSEWTEQSAIYRGTIENVQFWYYNHTLDGSPLIRDDYVEFISTGGVSERRLYYGAIQDLLAIKDGLHITRRYTFTKLVEDYPSALWQMMAARPLPVLRRPDWFVSADVIA